ncbi:hypothetical protein OS493_005546 [Desmophyllum pertusum]|uniref:Uncharacterized protein n=1 Tax=Desmophyllum pertusum TaxID=174260 RepID=A0A9W9YVF6_9CNID|nr:hypothetical protein OS493_005546 [Desmophyllum pertusum]
MGDKNGAETGTEPAQKCSETVDFTEEEDVSSLNTGKDLKDDSFSQQEERKQSSGDQIMFDNEVVESIETQQSDLSKEEMPKSQANTSGKIEGNSINIQTSKQDEKENQDNYKTIQETIQVDTKQTDEGHQNSVEKGPILSRTFERMEDNLFGATTTNKKPPLQPQKDEKRNVKPAFVKTANARKQGKAESRERQTDLEKKVLSDETNSKEQKRDRSSSDKINTGINKTAANTKQHAYKPGQSIPQKKVTGLHRDEVCQGGASTSEANKTDGSFPGKYAGKAAKSRQFDEDLNKNSSRHEIPSDSKETQKNESTSNRNEQELKAQDTTELLTKKSYGTSTMPSCNNTTENDHVASGCSSDKTPINQLDQGFERAEAAEATAYRKAPLEADEVTRRRPTKNKKRQERRQRRVEELLSENIWPEHYQRTGS